MNKAAIYHRPDSEYAYLYTKEILHLRIRTARDDISKLEIVYGDPYEHGLLAWWKSPQEMKKIVSTNEFDYYQIEVKATHKRLSYAFILHGKDGETIFYSDQGIFPNHPTHLGEEKLFFRFPFFHATECVQIPEWVKSTVWYQIFPERFANGDSSNDPENVKAWNPLERPERQDFYGGDLQGALDHLDHLTSLGVNGIYFTPIFKAGSNHKYDTVDYMEIDPDFGDKALFKKIIEACHERGIKVMLDAVFNHIGDLSAEWQDVLAHQEKSKYADWFHVNDWPATYTETDDFEYTADATYETFAFTPHMPKWNTANPEVSDYLLKIAKYWIEEFDIDAWRLDVANEVDHKFWKKFKEVCDQSKEDFYILGEIWHNSQSWLNGDEFTGVMNYAYTNSIIESLVEGKISLTDLTSKLNEQMMLYRKQTSQAMLNSLDSHDTARLLTVCREDKSLFKLVQAFTFMQPGLPIIYYGDEFGLTGENDPDCRKCMPWEAEHQDLELFKFFQSLVELRKKNYSDLSESNLHWELVDDEKGQITLVRGNIKGTFNIGAEDCEIEAGEILLSHQFSGKRLAPSGFVIYR